LIAFAKNNYVTITSIERAINNLSSQIVMKVRNSTTLTSIERPISNQSSQNASLILALIVFY
jgi:hypothetical protein